MVYEEEPNIGDLVYCHAIGSKYGWYLNQVAIVVGYISKPTKEDKSNFEYKIYLPSTQYYDNVDSQEFKKGNIEIIAKANGTIYSRKISEIEELTKKLNRSKRTKRKRKK